MDPLHMYHLQLVTHHPPGAMNGQNGLAFSLGGGLGDDMGSSALPNGDDFCPPWLPHEDKMLAEAMTIGQQEDAGFTCSFSLPGLGASISRGYLVYDPAQVYVDGVN